MTTKAQSQEADTNEENSFLQEEREAWEIDNRINSKEFRYKALKEMRRQFFPIRIFLYASIILWLWIFLNSFSTVFPFR